MPYQNPALIASNPLYQRSPSPSVPGPLGVFGGVSQTGNLGSVPYAPVSMTVQPNYGPAGAGPFSAASAGAAVAPATVSLPECYVLQCLLG